MKWTVGVLLGLSVAAGALGGCTLCDNLDCDPGGGGGGGDGTFGFTQGLVFVRNGSIYAADESDYSTTEALTAGGSFRHPSLSPDGRQVVAASANGSQLVRIPVAGGVTSTLLTASSQFQGLSHPVFTPDGQSVLFVFTSGGASSIGRVAADGSGGAELLVGGSSTSYASPSFDRQGNLLVASGTLNDYRRLELVDPETGAPIRTVLSTLGTTAQRLANRAVLSPDGTQVAFDAATSSGSRLFVVSTSGSNLRQLSLGAGNHTFPSWVGSGTLAFSSDGGGGDAAYTVSVSGGSPELVVPSADEPMYGPN